MDCALFVLYQAKVLNDCTLCILRGRYFQNIKKPGISKNKFIKTKYSEMTKTKMKIIIKNRTSNENEKWKRKNEKKEKTVY